MMSVVDNAAFSGQRLNLRQWNIMHWPELAKKAAPAREFILPDWIPARCVTLLHGFGGVGKSLLAQQIGTAGAFGLGFLGNVVTAEHVLGWWGEDEHDEIWRRQENINRALGITSLDDLDAKLFWRPCPGDDITLFTAANESDFKPTPEFNVLSEQIRDLKVSSRSWTARRRSQPSRRTTGRWSPAASSRSRAFACKRNRRFA